MDQPAAGFEANIVRRKLKITDRLPNNESNDAQGEIARLHVAAHDLRNPISGILSASEFLLEDLPDAREEHIAILRAIYTSSRFMLQLIDDIGEMSAGESNV
jgi:signal transduction histidine kinase